MWKNGVNCVLQLQELQLPRVNFKEIFYLVSENHSFCRDRSFRALHTNTTKGIKRDIEQGLAGVRKEKSQRKHRRGKTP